MGETHQRGTTSSRLGMRRAAGEIVEVQGGHIVRSTGRKDRHSKVCTAKGPRDRRVRLSAHTAIQFYDVQDRLGYDRPSKAVDWLIKKAKAAIDELAQLPAWNPITTCSATLNPNSQQQEQNQMNDKSEIPIGVHRAIAMEAVDSYSPSSSRRRTAMMENGGRILESSVVRDVHQQLGEIENPNGGSGFLPPSLETDIGDTIKSFFPTGETTSSSIQIQSYPPDLPSRTSSSQNRDLRLSLQSFQDPILLHHQHQDQNHHQNNEHVLFPGTTPLGFDGNSAGWTEQNQSEEHGRFSRMVAWNAGSDTGNGGHGDSGGGGGFIFNSPPLQPLLLGQSQYLSQRGPLQSSNTPIRAWIDPSITTATVSGHFHHYLPSTIHQSPLSGIGFAASGGFSGFRIPARIQGEEEHDSVSRKLSSASRH